MWKISSSIPLEASVCLFHYTRNNRVVQVKNGCKSLLLFLWNCLIVFFIQYKYGSITCEIIWPCSDGPKIFSRVLIQYKRCNLTSKGKPIVEIRWSYDRLISTMGFPIPVRWHIYIESGLRSQLCHYTVTFATETLQILPPFLAWGWQVHKNMSVCHPYSSLPHHNWNHNFLLTIFVVIQIFTLHANDF